jgi:hypothetical protein
VLCTVPDEASLRQAAERIAARGIRHYMFVEDDFGDQATALATEPISGHARKIFAEYPLWKPEAGRIQEVSRESA